MIDTQPELDAFVTRLTAADSIGCDTEFVRTRTYWPHLCLVQIAIGAEFACVDVLADLDVTAFRRALVEHRAPIVLHAVKQDLEAWFATWHELPAAVFDIQIGAGLLGLHPQIGYANLVHELLGVELDKDQTQTDWSRRPLTPAQLRYAIDDVAYLHALHDLVSERLQACGRYEWALADSAALVDVSLYDTPPDEAWRRLSGVAYLPVDVQARVRALAAWREARAKQSDRPRQWILGDKALMQIGRANPRDASDLRRIEDLPEAVARKQGDKILQALRASADDLAQGRLDIAQAAVPALPDKAHLRRLSGIVRETAKELDIAPELLATRRDINGIATGDTDARPLAGWRRDVIGERLLAAS